MNKSRGVAVAYLTTGILIITVSVSLCLSNFRFLSESEVAIGKVEELVSDRGSFKPKVSFIDSNGKTHTFISKIKCKPSCYQINEEVDVLYIGQTEEFIIDDVYSLWFASTLLFIIGLIFLSLSIYQVRKGKSE